MPPEQPETNTHLTLDALTDQHITTILGIYESLGLPVNYGVIPPVRILKDEMRGKYNGVELVPKPGPFARDKLKLERMESPDGEKYFHVSIENGGLIAKFFGLDAMAERFDSQVREEFLYH